MNNPYVKYALAVVVVVAISEVAPEVVNVFLALVLVGMLLIDSHAFIGLIRTVGSVGK